MKTVFEGDFAISNGRNNQAKFRNSVYEISHAKKIAICR